MIGKVYSLRNDYPQNAIRIDRTTKWGNKFKITSTENRVDVIRAYSHWLDREVEQNKAFAESVILLAGFPLVCWCAPLACHGDYLAKRATQLAEEQKDADNYDLFDFAKGISMITDCKKCKDNIKHEHKEQTWTTYP